tara:strand:- start:558 stop:683 length:126 start_codon:yes stop_codon:yes gene_type:complete
MAPLIRAMKTDPVERVFVKALDINVPLHERINESELGRFQT